MSFLVWAQEHCWLTEMKKVQEEKINRKKESNYQRRFYLWKKPWLSFLALWQTCWFLCIFSLFHIICRVPGNGRLNLKKHVLAKILEILHGETPQIEHVITIPQTCPIYMVVLWLWTNTSAVHKKIPMWWWSKHVCQSVQVDSHILI